MIGIMLIGAFGIYLHKINPIPVRMMVSNYETIPFYFGYYFYHSQLPADSIGEITEGEVPKLYQWDKRWGYHQYGELNNGKNRLLGYSGCAPTCVAMVLCAYTLSDTWTPAKVAQYAYDNGYYAEGKGTLWSFMTEGAISLGLNCKREDDLTKEEVLGAL